MGNQSCGYNLENRRIRLKMKGLQREGVWQNKRKKYCICNFTNGNYRFIIHYSGDWFFVTREYDCWNVSYVAVVTNFPVASGA